MKHIRPLDTIDPALYDRNTEIRSKVWVEYVDGAPVLAVDLDDCLLDTCSLLIHRVNERCGTQHKFSSMVTYDIVKTLNIDMTSFMDILHNSDYLRQTLPFPHAKEFVERLKNGEYNHHFNIYNDHKPYVVFITHRGFRPDGFIMTHDLLVEHDLIPDQLIVCPVGQSKLDVLDELFADNIQLIIEDQPKILSDFTEAGIQTVKNLRPYNAEHWTDYSIDLTKSAEPIFA